MKLRLLIVCFLSTTAPIAFSAAEPTLAPTEAAKPRLDENPVAISMPRPQYPFEMRRKGIGGEVIVEFTVDVNGRVKDAKVIDAPHKDFHRSAIAAVENARFKPGMKDGRPVAVRMRVPLLYQIDPPQKK